MKGDNDHVDSLAINVLSICSGYGGLDLGLDIATGGAARAVCYVEREAFAAALLARRMEEEALAPAPVWSDLRTFDGRAWRGVVDCITGGYPCQPFSHAGRRLGEQDARHLWPDIARIIGEVEPGLVFFENVAGHLTLGFDAVRADLERLGYRVAAGLFSAAEVGASHRRERLFILGVADSDRKRRSFAPSSQVRGSNADGYGEKLADGDGGGLQSIGNGGICNWWNDADRCGGTDATLADAELPVTTRQRRYGDARLRQEAIRPDSGGEPVADAADDHGRSGIDGAEAGTGQDGERRRRLASVHDELDAFPPGPSDTIAWRRIIADRPDLAPAVESGIRRVADGSASRLDRLRALGNGVVPLVAAYAFTSLWACLEQE